MFFYLQFGYKNNNKKLFKDCMLYNWFIYYYMFELVFLDVEKFLMMSYEKICLIFS